MSQIIATKFTTRAKLLKGDLPNLGEDWTTLTGSNVLDTAVLGPQHGPPLPIVSRPSRPPPGLPLPQQFGSKDGFPVNHGAGDLGKIGEVVTELRASIVGCHREIVRRETDLEICPSSNLHQFVPQAPHTRHEFIPPSIKSTMKKGNNSLVKARFY